MRSQDAKSSGRQCGVAASLKEAEPPARGTHRRRILDFKTPLHVDSPEWRNRSRLDALTTSSVGSSSTTTTATQAGKAMCEFNAGLWLTQHAYERTQRRLGSIERLRRLLRAGVRPCLHPQNDALVLLLEGAHLLADDKGTGAACILTDTNKIITLKPADYEELEAARGSPVISIVGEIVMPFEFETYAREEARRTFVPAVVAMLLIDLLLVGAMFTTPYFIIIAAVMPTGTIATIFALAHLERRKIDEGIRRRTEKLGPSLRMKLIEQGLVRHASSRTRAGYCSVCGKHVEPTWRFCRRCGAPNNNQQS